jgi:hypothetical protein
VFSCFAQGTLLFDVRYGRENCSRNCGGDFVLQGKDLIHVAVIPLGPNVITGFRVDKLRHNAHPFAAAPHAAFQHVSHTKFAGDPPDINSLALVGEAGIARDHKQ